MIAGGGGDGVEPSELVVAELYFVGSDVLLDTGHPLGAGDRGDVVALGQHPGQRDLGRRAPDLAGNGLDLLGTGQVVPEVLIGETRWRRPRWSSVAGLVLVVAVEPRQVALVATEGGPVEPLPHGPEGVEAPGIGGVGVEHVAVIEHECAHAGHLA